MKCKNCGAKIPSGVETCPVCKQKAQKISSGMILAISAGAVLVVAIVLAAVLLLGKDEAPTPDTVPSPGDTSASGQQITKPSDDGAGTGSDTGSASTQPAENSYTVAATEVTEAQMQQVVAINGDAQLTNEMLSYYYWFGCSSFINYYGDYIGQFLDVTQPHDSQYYDEGEITWQEYFLDMALQNFRYYTAMCADAKATGYKLSSEMETYLNDLSTTLDTYAANNNYASGLDYLRACFGAKSTVEGYRTFMRQYLTAMNYTTHLQQSLSFTEDEVTEYFESHKDTYAESGVENDGTRLTSVRHILIAPTNTENQADWLVAEQNAQQIYENWQNNPTEDYFAQLAATYSVDTGSSTNGGKYENVMPGEMVAEFNDWCFDLSREPGDHGLVKTSYGYHIMYFVDHGMEFWFYVASADLMNETYAEQEKNIVEATEMATDYEKIILVDPVGMYQ